MKQTPQAKALHVKKSVGQSQHEHEQKEGRKIQREEKNSGFTGPYIKAKRLK